MVKKWKSQERIESLLSDSISAARNNTIKNNYIEKEK